MKIPDKMKTSAISRLIGKILSVPIFAKTLGIGMIVGVVFGSIILIQTRSSLSRNLNQLLKELTIFEAQSLAANLASPMTTHDVVSIEQILDRTQEMFSDIRYIIVRDTNGRVVSKTFNGPIPSDLAKPPVYRSFPDEKFRILDGGPAGLIFEAMRPVVNGYAGYVQIGISEQMVSREVTALTSSIIQALVISVAIGVGFAFVLTFILTQPIHHLREAVDRIRKGDFGTRSKVFSDDEIGDLAIAFNEMADGLQGYRDEMEEKEKVRLALIERIVTSHEEERKLISRELHDQFGQSLLAMLVEIRSNRENDELSHPMCQKHEHEIENLIDELGRIVRGMRPTILDDYGLDSALENYAKEISDRFDLDIAYKYNSSEGLGRLPGYVEVTLYRIVQEAITNVIRHAEASHVSVVLLQSAKETTLLIEDDGKGFEMTAIRGDRGLGLMGMRERVSLLGGVLDIVSDVAEGTTIRAKIPNNGKG
jgi:signal transduction histidine kinase